MKKTLLLASLIIICVCAIGQTQLDSSFGINGIARAFFPSSENLRDNFCEHVIAHPDGSFFLLISVNQQIFLNHRLSNGAIDMNYGENGYSVPFNMSGKRAALLPSGKMIVGGGTSSNGNIDFVIVSYNADGSIDKTFADEGKRIIDFLGRDTLNDITIQSDGKILAVGSCNSGAGFAIARLNSDGSFDNSFSGDGKQTAFFTSSSGGNSVAVGSDGRIFVAGKVAGSMAIAAYLQNGDIDSSFGENGTTKFNFGDYHEATAVAIQTDQKIILGATNVGVSHTALLRLNPDGTLDNSFSGDGIEIMVSGSGETTKDLAIDQSGRILIVAAPMGSERFPMLARFTSSGTPDSSFSDDGRTTINLYFSYYSPLTLAIQNNGRILVGGTYFDQSQLAYFAARFNDDGKADNSLDNDGIVVGYANSGYTIFHASAIQADGKIVCVGPARTMLYVTDFVIARFNHNGFLDQTFSDDGFVTVRFEPPSAPNTNFFFAEANAIVIQPDGKIVVVGFSHNYSPGDNPGSTYNFAMARLNPDGSMDSSFSEDGKQLTDLFGSDDYAYAVAIQRDGKIVVGGSSVFEVGSGNLDFCLVRYNPDGSLDNSFSRDGKQTTEFFSSYDKVSKLIIQPDGKILAIGSVGDPSGELSNQDFAIARYLPNGYPDNSFGYDGAIKIDFQSFDDVASDAFLLPDGSILVSGTATFESGYYKTDFALAKLRSNGFLDSSFATNGKKIIPLGISSETCNAMGVQSNGSIVLGGSVSNPTSQDIGMIRLFGDGTLDNSLSFGGNHFMDLGTVEESIESIKIQNDRIYAIGSIGSRGYQERAGFIMALKLDCSVNVNIPDAFALPFGVDTNTVYNGYAPADDITLTARVRGKAPFTYLWNNGATTKNIHVRPKNTTTYSVTVTDASGCRQQVSKKVNVVDVRCGHRGEKVLLCQVQHGKREKQKTICVDPWSATLFLFKGAHLGSCKEEDLLGANFSSGTEEKNTLGMVASPNPTYDQFTLDIKLKETKPAELIIRDIQGRIMDRKTIHSTSLVRIGSNYAPGIYIAELRQGENKLVIKIVRASR